MSMKVPGDYGILYDSDLFRKLFPDFKALQKEAAAHIWDRILGRCGKDLAMPEIDTIIDLGCGEGTLTQLIAARAGDSGVSTIGIDCSAKAIKKARSRLAKTHAQRLRFLHHGGEEAALFEWIRDTLGINWARTALLCLSHTWFHLDQESLISGIRRYRPVLLVIDIFHTWDNTLGKLTGDKTVLELGKPLADSTCWLKTVTNNDDPKTILRGIWRIPSGGGKGAWVFPSLQHPVSSTSLFGSPNRNAKHQAIFEKS